MNTSQLFNPCSYGVVTYKELEENGVPYVRNQVSDELKDYVKERFHIPDEHFHLEELSGDQLGIIDNLNRVVSTVG